MSTNLAVGMAAAKKMLRAHMTNTIVLAEEALVTENEANRPMVSALKGVGINMVVLPQEMFYVLQDGVTTELRAREGCALQMLSEQQINMEQLSLQREKVVT